MKQLNPNTKKAQYFIYRYNTATATDLRECYNNPSTAKTRADFFCRMQMHEEGGQGYKVISYNCMKFSVGWKVGNALRIETADNSFIIPDAI